MRVKSVIAVVLSVIIMACSVPLSSSAAVTVSAPVVKGHSLSLNGTFDLNYYLDIPSQYSDKKTRVKFSWGDYSSEVSIKGVNRNDSNYVATCSLPSVCLTDTVKMSLLDNSGKTILTENYRAVDYIDSLALNYRDIVKNHDKYLQRLLEAILIYGSSAQQYYKYRTDDPADKDSYMKNVMTDSGNQKMKDVLSAFRDDAEGILYDIAYELRGSSIKDIEDDDSGLKYRGTSILFKGITTLRLYFDVTDSSRSGSPVAYINGQQFPVRSQDNAMILEVPGLYPDLFASQVMSVKMNDKTYKYMPLDYLAQCVADDNELSDLTCKMYAYGLFADLYRNNREDQIPDNGIPVVYLNIDESEGTIEDMIRSADHSAYCYGKLDIDVPEGFHYVDFPDNICESVSGLSMSIRGRGNSTWMKSNKKPFKIKLDKKADLFGLGSNKHWVLVANALDSTLMKDRITAWLGDRMGFVFTPMGVPVDVVISGEEYGTKYLGSYYLSENVRVDSNRLDIEELNEDDTDPGIITGGYLVQNGVQVSASSPDRFFTSRGADWATHTPSFDTSDSGNFAENKDALGAGYVYDDTYGDPELGDGYVNPVQQQYIQNHIQYVEDVMYQGGTAYRELMDVESAAKYWIINAASLNDDAYSTGSTYIYKHRDVGDTVGKLYWGPLWDFDYAWTHNTIYTGFPVGYIWVKPLICDRSEGGFIPEVQKQWTMLKPLLNELIADGGIIDQYYEETRASAEADHELYKKSDEDFDFLKEVNDLKQWIRNRIGWINDNIGDLGDYIHRVEFIVDGQLYTADYYTRQDRISPEDISHPQKEGLTFVGWQDEDGKILTDLVYVTKDMTFTAVYLPDSEVTHGEDIILERDHVTVYYNPNIRRYQIDYTVVPEDAIDKYVEWTSSDESYATVDEDGLISYNGLGEVTITGTLKNGVSRTFVLTVV
ncbi:Ig-like domain (group 2) [Ruminococcaceae bacterium YRB3002]|nr:Ig-like domain (group 2) [Ruminococcaceae bacterium YRB3002]